MKKISLLLALMCSLSAFSTRYLVQGTTGTNTWRTADAGEVNVTTSDFGSWYYSTFPAGYTYNAADEIWVAGGTYVLSSSFGARKVSVYGGFTGNETAVSQRSKVSEGKAWQFTNPTIFDGNNSVPQGFTTAGTATTPTTYLDGVTITKCKITNVTANVYGVGAYVTQGCEVRNCIVSANIYYNSVTTNSFIGYGGGIYLSGGKVYDSYVANNQVVKGTGGDTYGGGIAFNYTSESALNVVSGCTIENNVCSLYGGGIVLINGIGGTIENCIIKGNSCNFRGGGLGYAVAGAAGTSSLSVKNCQFIENSSLNYGGGVALNGGTSTATIYFEGNSIIGNTGVNAGGMYVGGGKFGTMKNCIFRDNKSTDAASGNESGALYVNLSNMVIQNCIFANNSSTANTNTNSTVRLLNLTNKLYNCTFANNSDPGSNGYTIDLGGQQQSLYNNVFWGNSAQANLYRQSVSYSQYNATTSDKNMTSGSTTTGNITTLTASNTFVTPTTFVGIPSTSDGGVQKAASAAADWSMLVGSPAVDAGLDLTSSGVTTDILGNVRPNGFFDMGAYERSGIVTGINTVKGGKLCYSSDKSIEIRGLNRGELVNVYSISGNLISSNKTSDSSISISVPKGVYLVRINDRINKVVVR